MYWALFQIHSNPPNPLILSFCDMEIGAGGSHNKQVELVDPVMGEVISACAQDMI